MTLILASFRSDDVVSSSNCIAIVASSTVAATATCCHSFYNDLSLAKENQSHLTLYPVDVIILTALILLFLLGTMLFKTASQYDRLKT